MQAPVNSNLQEQVAHQQATHPSIQNNAVYENQAQIQNAEQVNPESSNIINIQNYLETKKIEDSKKLLADTAQKIDALQSNLSNSGIAGNGQATKTEPITKVPVIDDFAPENAKVGGVAKSNVNIISNQLTGNLPTPRADTTSQTKMLLGQSAEINQAPDIQPLKQVMGQSPQVQQVQQLPQVPQIQQRQQVPQQQQGQEVQQLSQGQPVLVGGRGQIAEQIIPQNQQVPKITEKQGVKEHGQVQAETKAKENVGKEKIVANSEITNKIVNEENNLQQKDTQNARQRERQEDQGTNDRERLQQNIRGELRKPLGSHGAGKQYGESRTNIERSAETSGRRGRKTKIAIPNREKLAVEYEVIEASDLKTSHLPFNSFQKNQNYTLENERRYHAEKASQEKVLENSMLLDPDLLLEAPDANQGAPVIDHEGNVLGGNGRAMSIVYAYSSFPVASLKEESKAGENVVGEITQEMAKNIPLNKSGEIRLDQKGINHIKDGHIREIRVAGFKDVKSFVKHILNNIDTIYKGNTDTSFFLAAKTIKPWKVCVVKLEFSADGDFYRVKTAYPVRSDFFKQKNSLWERAQSNHFNKETPSAISGKSKFKNNDTTSKEKVKSLSSLQENSTPPIVSKKEATALVDKLNKQAVKGTPVQVIENFQELPALVREFYKGQETRLEGVFDPESKSIYIISDNLSSAERLVEVYQHGLFGHYGLSA